MNGLTIPAYKLNDSCFTGSCNGTFGELLQGVLPSDKHFLVTLPISLTAVAEFDFSQNGEIACETRQKEKACRAVRNFLTANGLPTTGTLRFSQHIPAGKGLASSTADMVAAIRAAASFYAVQANPIMIENALRQIEPSDGVMYDGVVSFFHRDVSLDEKLGKLPQMIVVGVDRGGKCDTIQFNAKHREIAPQIKEQYTVLLSEMKRAIKTADERRIGKIATRSSELSQSSNPHPYYLLMRELQETTGAIGLAAAHSGTYLGLLYSKSDLHHAAKIADSQRLLNGHGIVPEIFTTI